MTNVNKEISEKLLNDKNWELGTHNSASSASQMHYFYLADFSLGHLQLLAVSQENFAKTPPMSIE
jgi:hypothetical protein